MSDDLEPGDRSSIGPTSEPEGPTEGRPLHGPPDGSSDGPSGTPPTFGGTRGRFAAVAAVLAVGAVAAFALSQNTPSPPASSGTPTPPPTLTENCAKDRPAVALPSWYPADLPMPAGSYPTELPPAAGGLRRIVFSAQGTIRGFVVHALREWPKQGWTLGKGESEPGEAEDNFLKGERYGIFRAQSILCDQGRTWVLIVLNDPSIKSAPTPGFNTFNPSASPSPLTS